MNDAVSPQQKCLRLICPFREAEKQVIAYRLISLSGRRDRCTTNWSRERGEQRLLLEFGGSQTSKKNRGYNQNDSGRDIAKDQVRKDIDDWYTFQTLITRHE